jgi:hypothetical protein
METTVRNPQRGRLKTRDVEFTEENTAWFDTSADGRETYIIADVKGDLLVSEPDYTYPLRIYDMSKADIGYNQKRATELKQRYE